MKIKKKNKIDKTIIKLLELLRTRKEKVFTMANTLFLDEYKHVKLEDFGVFNEKIRANIEKYPDIVSEDLRDRVPLFQLCSDEYLVEKFKPLTTDATLEKILVEMQSVISRNKVDVTVWKKIVTFIDNVPIHSKKIKKGLKNLDNLENEFRASKEKSKAKKSVDVKGIALVYLTILPVLFSSILKDLQKSRSTLMLPRFDTIAQKKRMYNVMLFFGMKGFPMLQSDSPLTYKQFLKAIKEVFELSKKDRKRLKKDISDLEPIIDVLPISENVILQLLHILRYFGEEEKVELFEVEVSKISSSCSNLFDTFPILTSVLSTHLTLQMNIHLELEKLKKLCKKTKNNI